jgi:hypothetical protein
MAGVAVGLTCLSQNIPTDPRKVFPKHPAEAVWPVKARTETDIKVAVAIVKTLSIVASLITAILG